MTTTYQGPEAPCVISARSSHWFVDILRVLVRIIQFRRQARFRFLNGVFPDAFFTPGAEIRSLYGGGAWSIGINSLVCGSLVCVAKNACINIGCSSFIGTDSRLVALKAIRIENNVLVSDHVLIMDNDSHSLDYTLRQNDISYAIQRCCGNSVTDRSWDGVSTEEIRICNDVWIGTRSIIMKGVTIGERSIVGAGSVLTMDVPNDVVVAGNPARIIKHLNIK